MSSRTESRKKRKVLIIISCFVFAIGYYLLNVVSN